MDENVQDLLLVATAKALTKRPFATQLELLIATDELQRAKGNPRLVLKEVILCEPSDDSSAFGVQQLATLGTAGLPRSRYGDVYVSRFEVHRAIERTMHESIRAAVRYAVDARFPADVWDDKLPYMHTAGYLFNNHRTAFMCG